jgi:hypothetical protein
MKAIHFLCHHLDGKPTNSRELPGEKGRYQLGWWELTDEEARSLVGGFAYLHEKSSDPSYSENHVEAYVDGENEWTGKVALILKRERGLGHQKWRGKKAGQSPRDNFRVVDADLAHEKDAGLDATSSTSH